MQTLSLRGVWVRCESAWEFGGGGESNGSGGRQAWRGGMELSNVHESLLGGGEIMGEEACVEWGLSHEAGSFKE